MPERGVPTVLIDGPSAGEFLYTDPSAGGRRIAQPVVWTPTMDYSRLFPEPIMYRFESRTAWFRVPGSAEPAWLRLRFGWSEPGDPAERAIRRYGRAALLEHPELIPPGAILWPADSDDDEPIRILDAGAGPLRGCVDVIQQNPAAMELRGACPCGWETEFVPQRRVEELLALTRAHVDTAVAAITAMLRRDQLSLTEYVELSNILTQTNRQPHVAQIAAMDRRGPERMQRWRDEAQADALRYAAAAAIPTPRRVPDEYWGEPLSTADANWPTQGDTCAHICGADSDHACEARATMRLKYDLPSGGTRSMPICSPCYESETAAKENAHA